MPATGNWTFTNPGGWFPAINNHGDLVLVGSVKGPTGPAGYGIFFLGRDLKPQPVLLPGQDLPGGGTALDWDAPRPSITDSGVVAFLAMRQGTQRPASAYLWEQGTITPLLLAGTDVPGVGKIAYVSGVFPNNKNRAVLVSAGLSGSSAGGLYRVSAGKILPVAVPGQELPGGGKLRSAVPNFPGIGLEPRWGNASVSPVSEAGEHAFWATLEDGATAAYRLDEEGKLSLLLKSGTATELGTITKIGLNSPPALNSKGQVALSVQIDNGPATIVLLTPAAQ
jgi:hypothetical protein